MKDEDSAWLNQSELTQGNFSITTHNRPGDKKGGGIALVYRSQYNIRLLETGNTNRIEYEIWKLNYKSKLVHILGIHHSPPNNTDHATNAMFIDHLMDLLTEKIPKQQNKIIFGDFNMHIENLTRTDNII